MELNTRSRKAKLMLILCAREIEIEYEDYVHAFILP
jgi:hypothetical protein